MKLDNSNRRHSNIIAGILVISVASIFLTCAFGVWDHKVISNDNPLPNGVVISASNGNNIMENSYLVIPSGVGFLSKNERIKKVFDTVDEGWLYFDESNIPTSFPLTITQDILDTWSVTVYSYGGYEFVSGYANIKQKGSLVGIVNFGVDVIEPNELRAISIFGGEEYIVDVYTIGFTLAGNDINLDSNYLPTLYDTYHDADAYFGDSCPEDLQKEVLFKENMVWSGCDNEEQNFLVILAYKISVCSGVPNSRLKISSPVLINKFGYAFKIAV